MMTMHAHAETDHQEPAPERVDRGPLAIALAITFVFLIATVLAIVGLGFTVRPRRTS